MPTHEPIAPDEMLTAVDRHQLRSLVHRDGCTYFGKVKAKTRKILARDADRKTGACIYCMPEYRSGVGTFRLDRRATG